MATNHMLRSVPDGNQPRERAKGGGGQDFARLVRLMNEAPEPTRDKLYAEIGRFLVDGEGVFTERERAVVAHILASVSDRVSVSARRALASRLIAMPQIPSALLARLATAELETARPLLLHAPALGEGAMLEILKRGGPEHRTLLARRRALPHRVTETIAARGDIALLEAMLGNDQAQIGRAGFEILAERVQTTPALHIPVLTRHDLPTDIMADMFFFVGGGERRFILSECLGGEPLPAPRVDEVSLVTQLREQAGDAFVRHFATAFGISEDRAGQILADPSADALAVVCRAAGFARASFSTLALLTDRQRQGRENAQMRLDRFDDVDEEAARRLLALWQRSIPAMPKAERPASKTQAAMPSRKASGRSG